MDIHRGIIMKRKKYEVSISDVGLTALILTLTCAVCFILKKIDDSIVAVPMLFILAVFLVSRFTKGYVCGLVAALISVLLVNYVFTYPYFEFNFTLSGYPVTIISMLAVATITSALTTRIKQQKKMKIEVEKEKTRSNLLRSISHDIRTPLTSIYGAASAITDNSEALTDSEKLRLVSDIKDDATWLIRLVENLLSITRIDSKDDDAKIIKQPEAAEEVVAAAVHNLRKRFQTELDVSIPGDLFFIPMDAILIEQVIINLLENSAVHSETDKIELSILKNGDYAVFKVSDNGIGISPEILPHIFDGIHEGNGDKNRYAGIGLCVCNTIIKAHGGIMTAENKKAGGAIFRFTLPLKENNNEQIQRSDNRR